MKVTQPGFYKSRSGAKIEVVSVKGRGFEPIIGFFDDSDQTYTWMADGRFDKSLQSNCDIVSRWEDPIASYQLEFYSNRTLMEGYKANLLGYLFGIYSTNIIHWSARKTDECNRKYRVTVEEITEEGEGE